MRERGCLACERGVPKLGRRRCPACDHVFRGAGWDGVDVHWKTRHEDLMPYKAFWGSLCRRHRAKNSQGCPCCIKGIPVEGPRQCPECAQVFKGKGWEGLDAHWKAEHSDVLAYEDLVVSLCPAHKPDADRTTGFLPLKYTP